MVKGQEGNENDACESVYADIDKVVFYWTNFLDNLRKLEHVDGAMIARGEELVQEKEIKMMKALDSILWDSELLDAKKSMNKRIYYRLEQEFSFLVNSHPKTSDFNDMLEFKPIHILSDKATMVILAFLLGEFDKAYIDLEALHKLLSNEQIIRYKALDDAFKFVGKVLEHFLNRFLFGTTELKLFVEKDDDEEMKKKIPNYNSVEFSFEARCIVDMFKNLFGKNFRYNGNERVKKLRDLIEDDNANYELILEALDTFRTRRIDSKKASKPNAEEFEWLERAHRIAKDNPFVILTLCDYIIDCFREFKTAFKCNELKFGNNDESAMYLKKSCRDLVENFPNSVRINSRISDYFARYTPMKYFDPTFAEECLDRAFDLWPEYAKTSHRKGIFYRMTKGDLIGSAKWFKNAMELDPTHSNACLDYFKTFMRQIKEINIVEVMDKKIKNGDLKFWTKPERCDFLYLKGLASFAYGDKEICLETWKPIIKINPNFLRFKDLDFTAGVYYWNANFISSDNLRLWISTERNNLRNSAKKGELVDQERLEIFEILYDHAIGRITTANPFGMNMNMEKYSGPFSFKEHKKFQVKRKDQCSGQMKTKEEDTKP